LQYILQIDAKKEVQIMARFTSSEVQVMRILWEHGEMSPGQIQALFPRPIKNSALRALLSVLLEKGHVVRQRQGKAFFYKAKTRKEPAFRAMYRDMLNIFCGGSDEALICHILKTEDLSKEELCELKRLAEEKLDEENAK
jgi:predicted transcriptional regulator